MEAVDVLLGVDGVEHLLFVQMLGQGQLHQDAVNLGVFIELVDQVDEFFLGGFLRQVVSLRVDAQLFRGLFFLADVYLRGRVRPDEHRDQPGHDIVLRLEVGDFFFQFFAYLRGDFRAFD